MNELHRMLRDFADRQRSAEREALREYRRGDAEQANYWDGKVEAYGEMMVELNRLIVRENDA